MKRVGLTLFIFALLVYPANNVTLNSTHNVTQQTPPQTTRFRQEELERQRQHFKPAKDLLEQKGVPFEPEELLDPEWRDKLAPRFAQMTEMQVERRLGKELKGVQLADILYLPEKVQLTQDTVIIARRIVHEGKDAIIKGNHNIYLYPVEDWGLLGTSLEVAKSTEDRIEQSMRFVHAGFKEAPNWKTIRSSTHPRWEDYD